MYWSSDVCSSDLWFGKDLDRLTIKSEGEGVLGGRNGTFMETAEIQALYSRALDPYWNLQAGVRYDFQPNPPRTYVTVGIAGVAPYWFETGAALFLSNKGDVLGRRSEERPSELQSCMPTTFAVFILKKKIRTTVTT